MNPNPWTTPDDPARVGSPDYLPGDPEPVEDMDAAIDSTLDSATHADLMDWLTEGCFYPGLPVRHDWEVMAALRTAAISELDGDALALGRVIVRIVREQARAALDAQS